MVLVSQYTTLDLRIPSCCHHCGGNRRLAAQVVDKVLERGRISVVNPHSASAISQILIGMLGVDLAKFDLLLLEPSAETGCQQNPTMQRPTGIALSGRIPRKPFQPNRKWTVRHLRQNDLVADDMLQS